MGICSMLSAGPLIAALLMRRCYRPHFPTSYDGRASEEAGEASDKLVTPPPITISRAIIVTQGLVDHVGPSSGRNYRGKICESGFRW